VSAEADRDHGLELASEAGKVDLGVETTDVSAAAQVADSLQTCRWGDAGQGGEVLVGDPSILLQRCQDQVIDSVVGQDRLRSSNNIRPERITATDLLPFSVVVGELCLRLRFGLHSNSHQG
jgi:hypothetical protein